MQPMSPPSLSFTPLEQAVLREICKMHPPDRDALEAQLASAAIRRRENTGAGFYTSFDVDRSTNAPISGERCRRGPAVNVRGLQYGMGFILWIKGGYADQLEGYSYEESTTALKFESVGFQVV